MSRESQPPQDSTYGTEESVRKLGEFKNWLLRGEGRNVSCSCRNTLTNPSWASKAHGSVIHVCQEHAERFGIPQGPVWEDEWTKT